MWSPNHSTAPSVPRPAGGGVPTADNGIARGINISAKLSNFFGAGRESIAGYPVNASISQNVRIPMWDTEGAPTIPCNSNNFAPGVHATVSPSKPPRHTNIPIFMHNNTSRGAQAEKATPNPEKQLPLLHAVSNVPPKTLLPVPPLPDILPDRLQVRSSSHSMSSVCQSETMRPETPIRRPRASRRASRQFPTRIQGRAQKIPTRDPQAVMQFSTNPRPNLDQNNISAAYQRDVADGISTSDYRAHETSCVPVLSRQQQFRETNSLLSDLNSTQILYPHAENNQQAQRFDHFQSNETPTLVTVPSGNPQSERVIQLGGGLAVKSGLTELVSVVKDMQLQLRDWRSEESAHRAKETGLLQKILESNIALTYALTEKVMILDKSTADDNDIDIVTTVSIAQSYVKLHTFMGFDPSAQSTQIYATNADPTCKVIQAASSFALPNATVADILTFLNATLPPSRRNACGSAVLSAISRGQSRAHDSIQRDTVAMFFQFCPMNCPLRSAGSATDEMKAVFAKEAVETSAHKTDSSFDTAWYNACKIALVKARLGAMSTISDLQSARQNSALEPIWSKRENDLEGESVLMNVCSYAFVTTKVTFALQRLFSSTDMRRELKKSHQTPWALEALRVDNVLASQAPQILRIGKIRFTSRLPDDLRSTLIRLSNGQSTPVY